MKLILNEKRILRMSLEEDYIDKNKPSNTMRILVKHYLSKGMNKSQVYDNINKFFEVNLPDYNKVKWQKAIDSMTKYIHKTKDYNLLDINEVKITINELNTISKLNNKKLEKLSFVLLIYAKIYNQINKNEYNWVNEEHKYIFSDAKIVANVKDQGKMLHILKGLGLIVSSTMIESTNIKVNYTDEESDIVLIVSDFRNYVYEYLRWKGENIINCEECKILFYPTNNFQKYCKVCAKEIKNKQNIKYYHLGKEKNATTLLP